MWAPTWSDCTDFFEFITSEIMGFADGSIGIVRHVGRMLGQFEQIRLDYT